MSKKFNIGNKVKYVGHDYANQNRIGVILNLGDNYNDNHGYGKFLIKWDKPVLFGDPSNYIFPTNLKLLNKNNHPLTSIFK